MLKLRLGGDDELLPAVGILQVAAKGSAHYLVSKDIDPETSKAVSNIKKLSHEERVMELARMLSGSVLTEAAIANARALLETEVI